jgi:hypothetical protein
MKIRPELSNKNCYKLDKNRYYELKYFCFQYNEWVHQLETLDGYSRTNYAQIEQNNGTYGDRTYSTVAKREGYLNNIELVNTVAIKVDEHLSKYLIKGVTENLSYDILKVRFDIPCSRSVYYKKYRQFFALLDLENKKRHAGV